MSAIDAARHSVEESREFYERFAWLITGLITAAAFFVTAGGYALLRARAEQIAKTTAESVFATLTERVDANAKQLNDHLSSRDKFRKEMEKFKEQTTNDITASLIFMPKYIELSFLVGEYGSLSFIQHNAHRIATSTLEGCEKALSHKSADHYLLALIYGNQGIAYHLLGKYDAAYQAMTESLKYDGDRPATLYNIACVSCLLRRTDEAKDYLRRAILQESDRADQAWKDPDFETLKTDPDFLRLIGKSDVTYPS